eukprot:CAMPEP_0180566492 /NCGR_PEP_ID=MMETSP1037_2-20121125/6104_1 /TAXON_ID=632150 /ORGANISM="Azadinium spinosum, Strain 3D9" /LENGTH=157 /DNA_ID=CAMNT_0022583525 /DNA_START=428 /DNA_END=899 /DNA_ORIENTATION=-
MDVMSAKSAECLGTMPGGRCEKATGAPDCTYSLEDAGMISLDDLTGIAADFWQGGQKEYISELDKGVGTTFWDGRSDPARCAARMEAVRKLFKSRYPDFPETLEEPTCDFDQYYKDEFTWEVNHTGAVQPQRGYDWAKLGLHHVGAEGEGEEMEAWE